MRGRILAALLAALWALPALAADTVKYPTALVDQTCTDSYDTPANYTPGLTVIGGNNVVASAAITQTSGSPDGYCDHDSRIITGNITADTYFGPFRLVSGATCLIYQVAASAATGGDTKWRLYGTFKHPLTGAYWQTAVSTEKTGGQTDTGMFNARNEATGGNITTNKYALADPFYLLLDLNTATLVTANVVLFPGCTE